MGLKVEFANLAYLKKVEDPENEAQATDDQYVQESFLFGDRFSTSASKIFCNLMI